MTNEVRVDPLTGLRAIIAPDRAQRPGAGPTVTAPAPIATADDPFADGHEDRTPPELFAVRPGGGEPDTPGWTVRVVPNLFPALGGEEVAASRASDANPALFSAQPARGAHEVIVNAPEAVTSLALLPVQRTIDAVAIWRARIAHAFEAGAAFAHLTVNERIEAGASQPHTHAQLFAAEFVPAQVARERERFTAHAARTMGSNLVGDYVQEEVRRRDRIVAIDDEAVLIAPYGSRMPYQLMVAPRRPSARFEADGPTGAALLHDGLSRLARHFGHPPPLNLWVRTAPLGAEPFCWRIDVMPRLNPQGGLELGAGLALNVVSPEQAAAALRES
ncbi:MAG TPA: hypothetical protein VE913_01365 [Longimicrobium sp.]|nr:hypothetical protein [Longimicrobium sp.]